MAFQLQQQLQQRLASCSQASCSYSSSTAAAVAAAAAAARQHSSRLAAGTGLQHSSSSRSWQHQPQHTQQRRRLAQTATVVAAAAPPGAGDYAEPADADGDLFAAAAVPDPQHDTVYDSMTFSSNSTPDYEDPQWVEKVQDWEEFWYSAEDEELEAEEEGLSTAERSKANLRRAQLLVGQLNDLRDRTDIQHMITGEVRPFPYYEDTFKSEEEMIDEQMQFYAPNPNPDYDAVDLRALSEKRAQRAALDAELKARQALLARPFSFTLSQQLGSDARLASAEFDWIREEWTHEQIMDMIVGGGKYVHPDKVPARVLNPLLPMDFHNDVSVHVIPETEEFIESIGHMASEEDIAYLQSGREVKLHARDFVDPGLVFEHADGTQYVEAPPNPWAEMHKAEDARDLALFDALVEKIASRQRKREQAAAAGAGGAEGEEGGAGDDDDGSASYDADEEVLGSGFRAFVARDEASEPGLLVYEDDDEFVEEEAEEDE